MTPKEGFTPPGSSSSVDASAPRALHGPQDRILSRRGFLRGAGMGTLGFALGAEVLAARLAPPQERTAAEIIPFEVFGAGNPLTQEQMEAKITTWNADFEKKTPAERADFLHNNTYYATFFISEKIYNQFPADNSESFETFLVRHETEMRRMLKTAQPSILDGSSAPQNSQTDRRGFQFRRLVVVKDGVTPPGSWDYLYLNNGLKDSNGTFSLPDNPEQQTNGYLPKQSGYYDSIAQVDRGLLHEMGHKIFHLNDQYALDVKTESEGDTIDPLLIQDIPPMWRVYFVYKRMDNGRDDFMVDEGKQVRKYSSLQLKRRPNPHDFNATMVDYLGWPVEFPITAEIKLRDVNGVAVTPRAVEIYRAKGTGEVGYKKVLKGPPVYQGDFKKITPTSLFETTNDGTNTFVERTDGTLLVKIHATNGKDYFRWIDARDFNLGRWETGSAFVTMDMKVVATDDQASDPSTFDWNILYSASSSYIRLLPLATNNAPQK